MRLSSKKPFCFCLFNGGLWRHSNGLHLPPSAHISNQKKENTSCSSTYVPIVNKIDIKLIANICRYLSRYIYIYICRSTYASLCLSMCFVILLEDRSIRWNPRRIGFVLVFRLCSTMNTSRLTLFDVLCFLIKSSTKNQMTWTKLYLAYCSCRFSSFSFSQTSRFFCL